MPRHGLDHHVEERLPRSVGEHAIGWTAGDLDSVSVCDGAVEHVPEPRLLTSVEVHHPGHARTAVHIHFEVGTPWCTGRDLVAVQRKFETSGGAVQRRVEQNFHDLMLQLVANRTFCDGDHVDVTLAGHVAAQGD